jgi:hypothetical protein
MKLISVLINFEILSFLFIYDKENILLIINIGRK